MWSKILLRDKWWILGCCDRASPAPHDHGQHNQCWTPYAVVHSLVLLTMGIMMPETCWDKRLIIYMRLVASYCFPSLPWMMDYFLFREGKRPFPTCSFRWVVYCVIWGWRTLAFFWMPGFSVVSDKLRSSRFAISRQLCAFDS